MATGGAPEPSGARYDDFRRVNDLLEAVEAEIKVEFSTGIVALVDAAGGEADDAVAMWKVRAARETAWTQRGGAVGAAADADAPRCVLLAAGRLHRVRRPGTLAAGPARSGLQTSAAVREPIASRALARSTERGHRAIDVAPRAVEVAERAVIRAARARD